MVQGLAGSTVRVLGQKRIGRTAVPLGRTPTDPFGRYGTFARLGRIQIGIKRLRLRCGSAPLTQHLHLYPADMVVLGEGHDIAHPNG